MFSSSRVAAPAVPTILVFPLIWSSTSSFCNAARMSLACRSVTADATFAKSGFASVDSGNRAAYASPKSRTLTSISYFRLSIVFTLLACFRFQSAAAELRRRSGWSIEWQGEVVKNGVKQPEKT